MFCWLLYQYSRYTRLTIVSITCTIIYRCIFAVYRCIFAVYRCIFAVYRCIFAVYRCIFAVNRCIYAVYRYIFTVYRCCRVYNTQTKNCIQVIKKLSVANSEADKPLRSFSMFHDDTMKSFFRRLTFTPDGLLLIVPAGCYETADNTINTTYLFARNSFSRLAHCL